MEADRCRSYSYTLNDYYYNLFPLPVIGVYNSIVRLVHPYHTHNFDVNMFKSHHIMQSAWRSMRMEALQLYKKKDKLQSFRNLNNYGFGDIDPLDSNQTGKWKVFVLKWYDKPLQNALKYCPETIKTIMKCPDVHIAMFSILEPGKYIPEHKGPFTGCLRYHLGLQIPYDRENCYINVNKERFHWSEGSAFIFDDTYVHSVYNNTNEPRIILFVDIERPMITPLRQINQYGISKASLMKYVKELNDKSEETKELFKNYDLDDNIYISNH